MWKAVSWRVPSRLVNWAGGQRASSPLSRCSRRGAAHQSNGLAPQSGSTLPRAEAAARAFLPRATASLELKNGLLPRAASKGLRRGTSLMLPVGFVPRIARMALWRGRTASIRVLPDRGALSLSLPRSYRWVEISFRGMDIMEMK